MVEILDGLVGGGVGNIHFTVGHLQEWGLWVPEIWGGRFLNKTYL